MESARDTGSSVDFRTGPTSNLGEGDENYNSGKELLGPSSSPSTSELTSQDHLHFMPNTTTHHDQKYLFSELHNTSLRTEKGDGSKINSHLESHPTNPFGEVHPSPLENNSAFSSLSSPSSQNAFLALPNDDTNSTTHVATVATISEEMHKPFYIVQQENGSSSESSAFGRYHDDVFEGETYDDDAYNGEMLGMHSSLEQSAYESSSIRNPFEVQTSNNSPLNGDENHDHRHESYHKLEQGDWSMPNPLGESHVSSSSQHLDPLFTLEESIQNQQPTDKTHEDTTVPTNFEAHHTFSVAEQGLHNMASSNLGTDSVAVLDEASVSKSSTQDPIHSSTNEPSKVEVNTSKLVLESSVDNIPNSSMHSHEQKTSDVTGNYSSSSSVAAINPNINNVSETQNPPVQVMERPGDPATTSNYRIPSHVFARNRSNTQWSTASNESLFSIQMGNMSFSREMPWYYKSGELDTKTSDMQKSGPLANNQPPLPPQPPQPSPVSKFNDMSQRTTEQHEGWRITEEKAAETMREVIMEENLRKGGLSVADVAPHYIRHCDSNDNSNHSNGSTKSFAFKVSTDGDRALSSNLVEEIRKQQKQSEQQAIKETPNAAQAAKSTINAPQNKWLSCFTCCH